MLSSSMFMGAMEITYRFFIWMIIVAFRNSSLRSNLVRPLSKLLYPQKKLKDMMDACAILLIALCRIEERHFPYNRYSKHAIGAFRLNASIVTILNTMSAFAQTTPMHHLQLQNIAHP